MDWNVTPITCGLLWCFYQLFGLSFWRHPFTAEDPLVIFLQIWWRKQTHLHLLWAWGCQQMLIFGQTIPLSSKWHTKALSMYTLLWMCNLCLRLQSVSGRRVEKMKRNTSQLIVRRVFCECRNSSFSWPSSLVTQFGVCVWDV